MAGVDEAGRGSLAGPLLAAGVLIDLERIGRSERLALARLDDSKQKSAEEREELYPHVIRAAACVSVAVRSVRAIDANGLHVSNIAALTDCMRAVAQEDATRLVDGFRLPRCELEHTPVSRRRAQRGDRRRLGDRQGDPRPLHAAGRRALPGVELRGERRLLDPGAPRGDLRARHLPAPPPLVRIGRLLPARARRPAGESELMPGSEGVADVIDIREAIRAEADADDVEAVARDA